MTTAQPIDSRNEVAADQRQQRLLAKYREVRAFTDRIVESLEPEDCVIQSMADVSPTRWHLAHTTWFFETFVLKPSPGFRPFSEPFEYLFNSYYNAVGQQFARADRGLLSRPTVGEVFNYRQFIDQRMHERLDGNAALTHRELDIIELGLNHEQQHQELMLTDIKHVFSRNPLAPQYRQDKLAVDTEVRPHDWVEFDEGLYEIGFSDAGFAFDNESPRHRVFLDAFALGTHPVSVGEYLNFMNDGGYQRPELWLSLGWQQLQTHGWRAPLYWQRADDGWRVFTLCGLAELNPSWPVCHLSYFEADAFARWSGARLPSEAEWEVASQQTSLEGNFADVLLDAGLAIHPCNKTSGPSRLRQLFGDVWEWTASPYAPYPGYDPPPGALGEYNGKFMCNQYVLRGGSCATPNHHVRRTYRNFFPPEARWQFSGLRLARKCAL